MRRHPAVMQLLQVVRHAEDVIYVTLKVFMIKQSPALQGARITRHSRQDSGVYTIHRIVVKSKEAPTRSYGWVV